LTGAPITFSIASGSSGKVAQTSGGTTTTSLSMTTDGSGNATVYYQSGSETIQDNTINMAAVSSAGTVTVSFTIHCGIKSGLLAWYEADNGVTHDGSGNISAITDLMGSFSLASSPTEPVLIANDINGKPAMRFSGSSYLYNPSNMNLNADYTMIIVSSTTSPGTPQFAVSLGDTAVAYAARSIGYSSGLLVETTIGGYSAGQYAPAPSTFVVEAISLNSGLTQTNFYRNGVLQATVAASGFINTRAGVMLGAFNGAGDYWYGDIVEVLIYDHQLTSTEMQSTSVFLADKYGLYNPNATWPSAYSSAVQAEINRNQWGKVQADNYVAMQAANPNMQTNGLVLWLEADNGVTYDGSDNVSAWADQTSNYPLAYSGVEPTYIASDINGKPAVRFTGSQSLYNPSNLNLNADHTMIVVSSNSSPSSQEYSMTVGDAAVAGAARGIGYYSGLQTETINGPYAAGAAAPPANTFVAEGVSMNSALTLSTFYRNGQATAAGAVSGSLNTRVGIMMAALNGFGGAWGGDIAEALIYDHQLSAAEMNNVSVYLANKYNLSVSLPPITISSTLASSGWGTTVTFSPVPYSAEIRYTLDGSNPLSSSTLYSSPFTITASSMVNAAVFLNGVQISPVAFAPVLVPNPPPSSGSGTPPTINLIKPANATLLP
jgi:Chitobiase/beta-hexosaminidase C-terminal domain/Concanavalin A-like lectin/glucanases superfamily